MNSDGFWTKPRRSVRFAVCIFAIEPNQTARILNVIKLSTVLAQYQSEPKPNAIQLFISFHNSDSFQFLFLRVFVYLNLSHNPNSISPIIQIPSPLIRFSHCCTMRFDSHSFPSPSIHFQWWINFLFISRLTASTEPIQTACFFILRFGWLLCSKPNQTAPRTPLTHMIEEVFYNHYVLWTPHCLPIWKMNDIICMFIPCTSIYDKEIL